MNKLLVGALAVLALAAGCEPFETELTLNADGSGRMVQKGQLSAGARMMLQEGFRRTNPYRNVMTEEAVKGWNAANPDAGVKVTECNMQVADDGTMTFSVTVTFESLPKLSQSAWGFALQIAATGPDPLHLKVDDPARVVINGTAVQEMKKDAAREDARHRLQFQTLQEALSKAIAGQIVRTVVRLPAPALSAEGATLSADKKTATYECKLGATVADLNTWLEGKPVDLTLPANLAGLRPFETPTVQTVAAAAAPVAPVAPKEAVPGTAAKACKLRLSSANVSRSINFGPDGAPMAGSSQNESLNLSLSLFGTVNLLQLHSLPQERQPVHMLSAARDADGKDLRSANSQIWLHTYWGWPNTQRVNDDQQIGNVSISLKATAAKELALLEGYVTGLAVTEEGKLELKPLKEYIGKEQDLNTATFKLLSIEDKKVEYMMARKTKDGLDVPVQVTWFHPDGRTINGSSSGTAGDAQGRLTYKMSFPEAFPENGYAVVTYARKIEEVQIPFSYRNVKLP